MRQSSPAWLFAPSALMRWGLALFAVASQAKKLSTALEASYKDRITAKIASSLEATLQHLGVRLTLDGKRFSGYEFELDEKSENPVWRRACTEVDAERDTVENCALRQLHALAALCDGPGDLSGGARRKLIDGHLKALKAKEVSNLAIKRNKFDGVDIWFHHKTPTGSSDDVDASPAIQASALMALARCAAATGQKEYFSDAESWFEGLQKVYPQKLWNSTLVSFHKSGIIWESLALVLSHVPADSDFHDSLLQYVRDFEAFLLRVWNETPETWSFSSARALALRWQSKALKGKKSRTMVKKWAQEHVDRFLGRETEVSKGVLARIGGQGYTCGPLQGLTSLAAVVSDAELVQVVLKLLEKDLNSYQLGPSNEGPDKVLSRPGHDVLSGAFFRDDQQLKLERRRSLRVDDVVQCAVAMTQALKTLEGIQGVTVDADASAAAAKPDEAGAPAEGRAAEL